MPVFNVFIDFKTNPAFLPHYFEFRTHFFDRLFEWGRPLDSGTKLLAAGYDVAAVPESELEPGAERTPVTNALLHWARTLDDWRARGQQSRAEAHEALYKQLVDWRQAEASRLRMAPASVLADHLAFKIALVKPQEAESLSVLGARIFAIVHAFQDIISRVALRVQAMSMRSH